MTEVAIVTGAASGIGLACARRLTDSVDVLVLADLVGDALAEVAGGLSGGRARCEAVATDIADPAAVDHLVATAGALGDLRGVAHVAGISPTMADWDRVLVVDLVGTALLVEAVRPLAVDGTSVVCVASMAAQLVEDHAVAAIDAVLDEPLSPTFLDDYRRAAGDGGEDPGAAYAWAKRGVRRLVRREATAFGTVGARITSVSPGNIDTPMGRRELERQPGMQMLEDLTPLRRTGRADEIAAAIAFLLSDQASFVTGTDLLVDGGTCAAVAQLH